MYLGNSKEYLSQRFRNLRRHPQPLTPDTSNVANPVPAAISLTVKDMMR